MNRFRFSYFARRLAVLSGRPATFLLAVGVVLLWAITGPIFGYSDTWQLIINTSTTIITFLMVFLIQNTQNRDTEAIQIKLDLRHYAQLAAAARQKLRAGKLDTDSPELKDFRQK